MIIDFHCTSIEIVSKKIFLLKDAPTKPMVSASRFPLNEDSFKYQIDIAVYLPQGIKNLRLKQWEDDSHYISPVEKIRMTHKKDKPESPKVDCRQITIEFDGISPNILKQNFIEFDLYVMQLRYISFGGNTEAIWVNYAYDDPETTRGTVTTVRDIKEKQSK
ncbi:hypothetical protein [uncultured Aquimarina sp.]|uniref:hypothetical protein n=1 Tax=uncultured Aquimarina sp. TaxID=575652 RepID=UPI002612C0AC|nr:hypothetical protein [uncultured Aquimarina sp.]